MRLTEKQIDKKNKKKKWGCQGSVLASKQRTETAEVAICLLRFIRVRIRVPTATTQFSPPFSLRN